MFKKIQDQFSKDLLDAVSGVLKNSPKQIEEKAVNKHGHDHPGKEDHDVDNDGDNDSTDSYLKNRRKAIAKNMSMKKEEAEHNNCGTPECCGQCDTPGQIDELSTDTMKSYGDKRARTVFSGGRKPGQSVDAGIAQKSRQSNSLSLARTKINRARDTGSTVLNKEEIEQIDELSKGTMGRYINKAATKMGSQGVTAGLKIAADEKSSKNFKDMGKREKGIKLAVSKLTKEEQDFIDSLNDADAEQIDEISAGMKGRYKKAASRDVDRAQDFKSELDHEGEPEGSRVRKDVDRIIKNRETGMKRANEDVELDEARGRPKKGASKDFTIHPITKQQLMHNNPEHMKTIGLLQKNNILEKPKVEAGQHIINQLQKAKLSMRGGETIHFTHGESNHVSGVHAAKLLTKYAGMKPSDKETFQKKIGHSHENLKSEL